MPGMGVPSTCSSCTKTARPLASWPVTTVRTFIPCFSSGLFMATFLDTCNFVSIFNFLSCCLCLHSLQRDSGAHARNGRDPAVDQEVCPDDVRRIVRREVNCQLRDFQRIGHPLAWIVGSEDALNRRTLLFAWEATEHRRVRRAWAQGIHADPAAHEFGAEDSSEMHDRGLAGRDGRGRRPPLARANGRIDDHRRALPE